VAERGDAAERAAAEDTAAGASPCPSRASFRGWHWRPLAGRPMTQAVGSAGEHIVQARLLVREWIVGNVNSGGMMNAPAIDLFAAKGPLNIRIAVKTTGSSSDTVQWGVKEDWAETSLFKGGTKPDFVVFVWFPSPEDPDVCRTFVVPASVVEAALRKSHEHWHRYPRRDGMPRKRSARRDLLDGEGYGDKHQPRLRQEVGRVRGRVGLIGTETGLMKLDAKTPATAPKLNDAPQGEITARMNERDYPHIVELPPPPGGFRARSDDMLAFHRERDIQIRRGQGRNDDGQF